MSSSIRQLMDQGADIEFKDDVRNRSVLLWKKSEIVHFSKIQLFLVSRHCLCVFIFVLCF